MRPQHLIRRTKSDAYPASVICLDCDYAWKERPSAAKEEAASLLRWVGVWFRGESGVYGTAKRAEGRTKEEFWDALFERMRKGGQIWCVSERASLVWSLLDLWEMVERREVDLCGTDERMAKVVRDKRHSNSRMRVVLENPPFIVGLRKKPLPGTVKILDAANYGLQPSSDNTSVDDRLSRVRQFVTGMVAALQSRGLGSLKDTVGSQAAYSFRRKHLTHMMQVHNNERALNLEGDSYYGGRCEAFMLGRQVGPVYHLDVSAMYPYCAGTSDIPVALAGCCDSLGPGDQPQLGAGCGLIADVTVDTDEPAYPYRDMLRKITTWPIGVFRTTLAGPELLDALSRDRVTRWHRAAWYEMAPALRSYSQCVLDMRREYAENDDLKAWAKALGVCLIGKFGTKDRRWVDARSNLFHGPWATWWQPNGENQWNRWRSISGYTQTEMISGWSYDAMPAVASWVTSLARMRLLSMIRCASWEEVYYCDTDALMVSLSGLRNLERAGWVRDGEPGYLRVKNVSQVVDIHGVKSYDEESRSVRAGQPHSVAGISAGKVHYWTQRSPAGSCREGRAPQAIRIALPHDRAERYKHGEVCADGSVVPFQLNEG